MSEDPKAVVTEQANDADLWKIMFTSRREQKLQAALRRLHAAVEGKTSEQRARAVLD